MSATVAARELAIANQRGLHARASAKFVKCAEAFDAEITVTRDGMSVPATSIMGLMMLAAGHGSVISVTTEGADEEAAMAALQDIVNRKFEED